MKRFFFFLVIFTGSFTQAQTDNILLKTKVNQDTVLLRWAPVNADLLIEGLRNGYVIQRINHRFGEDPQGKTEFVIEPFEKRRADFQNAENPELRNMAEFISDLLSTSNPSEASKKMTFAVLSLGASTNRDLAKMLGLFYEDVLKESHVFTYRILLRNTDHKSNDETVTTAVISKDAPLTALNGSAHLKIKQVYLSWEALSLQTDYVAYWIERSDDSIHFTRQNTLPYFFLKSQDEPDKKNCDFVDTAVHKGHTYYYRITGINHFAEATQSSNIVRVYVPKSICGEAYIDSIKANGVERQIHCKISTNCKTNNIQKWQLWRSDSLLYGYEVLTEQPYSGYSSRFITSVSVPLESGDRYHYKLVLIGDDNDTVSSYPYYFFTLDQIPPMVPGGLDGVVNDSGIVSLTWKPNPEKDIRGYRVYRSNALHEEFTEVTQVFCTDAHFSDTLDLRNLTSEIYYRISAVDLNYNNSKTSEPLKLLKPDTIAPVAAIFHNYEVDAGGLLLAWNNSSSADVLQNVLIRQNDLTTDTLIFWADTTQRWTDTTGIPGKSYYYSIITKDRAANSTVSEKLFVNYETGLRKGVSNLQGIANRAAKQIELSWKLPEGDIYSIQIYRAKNDDAFILYKTLRDPLAVSFTDQSLAMNNAYRYKVKIIYKSGISSVLSEAFVISY